MIKYVLKKNNNSHSSAYGKYYAHPVVEETIGLADLARHMEDHSTGFSEAMCMGVLTAMVKCIKEQLLAGKNVKIDNLAIFSCGIRNREGAVKEEDFSVANNIAGVKLRARATGNLSNAKINLAASLRKASVVVGSGSSEHGGNGGSGNGSTGNGADANSGQDSNASANTGNQQPQQVTISVAANPSNGGTVSGGGSVNVGSQVTLTASANSGYQFQSWNDGNTQASREVTASEPATYTATFVTTNGGGGYDGD